MVYLLDSDILISFLRKKEPGLSVFRQVISKKVFISIVSWIEIIYGIKKSTHPAQRKKEFEEILRLAQISTLPIDEKTGERFTELKVKLEKEGKSLADFDLLIAGTAMVHHLILATGNKKHFSRIKDLKIYP